VTVEQAELAWTSGTQSGALRKALISGRETRMNRRGELTPRDRVLLALAHREADRVPVDFLATPETWNRLAKYLGIPDREAILSYLGVDLRHPRHAYTGPALHHDSDGNWKDEWGVVRRRVAHEGGAYEEIVHHPLARLQRIDELNDYPWPRADWWDVEALRDEICRSEETGPYAIALEEFGDPGGIFEISWYMRGIEAFLIDLMDRPELACAIMERVTDYFLARLDRVLTALGERIDLIWTSDDVAHQHGPFISPVQWKELIAPYHERLNRRVHELGSRVMYHSCGAVRSFIPGLIDIGVDVLDVLQFSASGMDPRELKSSFGGRLCFHGGVDVQQLLPRASVEEVRRTTRELISILGAGGGFVLSPTHNIQIDTPPENIVAVYREAGSCSAGVGTGVASR
jgi:uroporphyrinogen decarboxylase